MIKRGERPDSNFYTINKSISEDKRLSWAARGMLIFLLGKPDHWRVSVEHLRKETEFSRKQTGRDGIYALLEELSIAGYVKRERVRGTGGEFSKVDYIVSESCEPHTGNTEVDIESGYLVSADDTSPLPENQEVAPLPALPYTAEPLPANPTLVKNDSKQCIESKLSTDKTYIVGNGYSPEFEAAWAAYPRRPGMNKAATFKLWKTRLKEFTAEQMIEGTKKYAAYCLAVYDSANFYKQPTTFFGPNAHFMSDWTIPAAGRRNTARPSAHFDLPQPGSYGQGTLLTQEQLEGLDDDGYF
jgi:hypothetical protein